MAGGTVGKFQGDWALSIASRGAQGRGNPLLREKYPKLGEAEALGGGGRRRLL
jgi:hypothetical protein